VVGFQDRVQAVVLRVIEAHSAFSPAMVRRLLPEADVRDIRRAVEVLVDGGLIEFSPRPTPDVGVLPNASLTERGRARLRAEWTV
jgi:hypothetical protein